MFLIILNYYKNFNLQKARGTWRRGVISEAMSESPGHRNISGSKGRKSIPEHITDGSLAIDAREALGSILKQYPGI